jgi:hypothetical protein
MAFGRQLGAVLAVQPLDLAVIIIDRIGQVRSSAFGLASSDRAIVQHNN